MFGTISLTYTPPASEPECAEVSLKFSSEANLPEVLRNFENFLRVLEYPLDVDESLVVRSEIQNKDDIKNSAELSKISVKSVGPMPDWQILNCSMNSSH